MATKKEKKKRRLRKKKEEDREKRRREKGKGKQANDDITDKGPEESDHEAMETSHGSTQRDIVLVRPISNRDRSSWPVLT
jgi:hypothetical protein